MKRLIVILVLVAGAWIGISYYSSGRLPWVATSPEEQQVADLRTEFGLIRQQWQGAARASSFGVDTGGMADDPVEKLKRVEQRLAELVPTLKTAEARNQAGELRREILEFKSTLR